MEIREISKMRICPFSAVSLIGRMERGEGGEGFHQ